MRIIYACICFFSVQLLFAQTEIPLENNPILESHFKKWEKGQLEQFQKLTNSDLTPRKSPRDCALEQTGVNYVLAGEDAIFVIDTVGFGGGEGASITCKDCENTNFGVARLDSTTLSFIANADVQAGLDTINVEFCDRENKCTIFDFVILVKRASTSYPFQNIDLQVSENQLISLNNEVFPGEVICSEIIDCEDNYDGRPTFWISNSKPYEFFYGASLYQGSDSICLVVCDEFTICDTFNTVFNIQGTNREIPFFDDFSYDGPYPSTELWVDNDPFVNNAMAINPPSVGVATFDGLDAGGTPRSQGNSTAERLTSTYLNLAGENNQLYLSFWLQPQGLGDRPENEDAMRIEFRKPNGEWQQVSKIDGVADSIPTNIQPEFKFYFYPLEEQYLYDGFQFRFISSGSRKGILDLWHLDYVRLDENANRPVLNDIAFTTVPASILSNYTALPWRHFEDHEEAELAEFIDLGLYNHFDETVAIPDSEVRLDEILTSQNVFSAPLLNGQEANIPNGEYVTRQYSLENESPSVFPSVWNEYLQNISSDFTNQDSLTFVTTYELEQGSQAAGDNFAGIQNNDKVSRTTNFHNYFAHDDGTAESNIVGQNFSGRSVEIATEFTANVADSLRAVQIHIPHTTRDVSDQQFTLKVWIGELDEEAEFQALFRRPVYVDSFADSLQGFTTYALYDDSTRQNISLYIPPGKFYIGWEQFSPCTGTQCIPFGYDKNTPSAARFNFRKSSEEDTWSAFSAGIPPGALMIRPVVGDIIPRETGVISDIEEINSLQEQLDIFPNPASNVLNFKLQHGDYQNHSLQIFNTTGQLITQQLLQPQLDISNYPNGIYFVNIINQATSQSVHHKIIVSK